MTSHLLKTLLGVGPIRRIIMKSGDLPFMESAYRRISGATQNFQSMDEARSAIKQHRPETRGHFEPRLIASNFTTSAATRMGDYPVLFWLQQIASQEELRVFDFGGGIGQTFANFSRLLPDDRLISWVCQDLPAVISSADSRFYSEGLPERLSFTSELSEATGSNVLLVAGAFHYWEGSVSSFLRQISDHPKHFIINRSPMTLEDRSFAAVQEGDTWAVPCMVRSVTALQKEMSLAGYRLVDSWKDPEKSLTFPWLPKWNCHYHGLYFQRSEQTTWD